MRPFIQVVFRLSFAFTLFALQIHSSYSHAATPTDIATFQELLDKSSRDISTTDLEKRLIDETLKQVDSIARTRVYPQWFRSSQPLIVEEATEQVIGNLRSGKRRDAIIDAITGVTAERVMAKAAGLPTPVVPKQNPNQPLSLSASVSGGGLLGLVAEESRVVDDRGSFGSGNGILDPGEFAKVKLVFRNLGKERLTSTSVYVDSLGPCLYSEDTIGGEVEMPELEPGESGYIELNLYASAKCPTDTTSLRLRAHDSHLFSKNPTRFDIKFKLGALGKSRLVNLRVDTDDYGHSEPTNFPKLKPLDRVEIATGLSLTGSGYSEVEQKFHVMKPLQSTHSPAFVPIRRTANGSVAPMADDLDLSVPEEQKLQAGLQSIAARMEWVHADDARIFVSVDSTIVRDSKTVTAANIETVVRMDKSRVEAILREHVNIDPVTSRLAPSSGDLPIIAVNGFTVSVVDPDSLMQDLESAAKIREVAGTEKKPGIAYVLRHYIELPIQWTPLRCELKPASQNVSLGATAHFTAQVFPPDNGLSYDLKQDNSPQSSGQIPSSGRLSLQFQAASPGTQNVIMAVKRNGKPLTQCTAEIKVPEPTCSCSVTAPPQVNFGDTFSASGTATPGCPKQPTYTMTFTGQKQNGSLRSNRTVKHSFKADRAGMFVVRWTLSKNGGEVAQCSRTVDVVDEVKNVFAVGISKVKTQSVIEGFADQERVTMGTIHLQAGGSSPLRFQGDFIYGKIANINTVIEFGIGPRYNVVENSKVQVGPFAELGIRAMSGYPIGTTQAMLKTGVSTELTLGLFAIWLQTSFTPKTPDDKLVESFGTFAEYGVLRPHMSSGVGFAF
jgi:hypothetical protein